MTIQAEHQTQSSSLKTNWKNIGRISGLALGSCSLLGSAAVAQITVDGTTPTVLDTAAPSCAGTCILGGSRDGSGSGANVFHSFSEFNVGSGQTVTFDRLSDVNNIFTRVTGLADSNIEGTLGVNGPANLFLLNPNGILFGNNAKLNIQGSFLATTAQSFIFNNGQFSAAQTREIPSLLTISTPIGVQFGAASSPIELSGTGNNLLYSNRGIRRNFFTPPTSGLVVPAEEKVALLGSGISLQGSSLIAENGQIEVGSVGSSEFVSFTDNGAQWQFGYDQVSKFEDISLTSLSGLDVSGSDAGSIHLQGRRISVEGGSSALAQVSGQGNGTIRVDASEKLQLAGVNLVPPPTGPFMQSSIYVEVASTGEGTTPSSLIVSAPNIDISGGAQIGLTMAGSGEAGNLEVLNAQTINVEGLSNLGPSSIFTTVAPIPSTSPTSRGGNLNISAEELSLSEGASIAANTFGPGQGGHLNIEAKAIRVDGFGVVNTRGGTLTVPSVIETASLTAPNDLIGRPSSSIPSGDGSGSSGSATLTTRQLVVTGGGQVRTGTNSNNQAGDLIVNVSESVTLSGRTSDGRSGIFSSAREGSGMGGNITINTSDLFVLEGATIDAGNFPSSESSDRTPGTGPAGNINLTAQSILLKNGALITADTVAGDRAYITIQSEDIILRNGSNITTNATGSASGGDINIETTALIALENSDITANAENNTGGRVIISAQTILGTEYRAALTDQSDITATSALGPAFSGSVELNKPDGSPADGTTQLPENTVAPDQIAAACRQQSGNTFIATGRGGLPSDGNQLVIADSIWSDFRFIESTSVSVPEESNRTPHHRLNDEHIRLFKHQNLESLDTETTPAINASEANTWFINHRGEIVLSASVDAQMSSLIPLGCLA